MLKRWTGALSALVFLLITACSAPARPPMPDPPKPGEQVRRLDIALEVRRDGITEVTETIRYDFGANPRGSFVRILTAGGTTINRGTGLGLVRGDSTTAPGRATITPYGRGEGPLPVDGRQTVVRFSPPHGAPFGRFETFQVRYELKYVLGEHDGRVSLATDLVGEHWRVPVRQLAIRARTPGPVVSFTCPVRPERDPCEDAPRGGGTVTAELGTLSAGTPVSVGTTFRASDVTVLEEPSERYIRYFVYGGLILALVVLGVVSLLTMLERARRPPPPRGRPLRPGKPEPDFEGAAAHAQEAWNEIAAPDPTDAGGSAGVDYDRM